MANQTEVLDIFEPQEFSNKNMFVFDVQVDFKSTRSAAHTTALPSIPRIQQVDLQ